MINQESVYMDRVEFQKSNFFTQAFGWQSKLVPQRIRV